ncbi:hypothetical protein KLO01_20220 [Knoellia locipacati]|uniref:Uncharacterized protein n=1 Tax=Knoellia locipacati TaxID=882824 RepID=A0A512T183_9MICO|nr:hypothetical protein KLO01_20220 [Knoellia locipacati]
MAFLGRKLTDLDQLLAQGGPHSQQTRNPKSKTPRVRPGSRKTGLRRGFEGQLGNKQKSRLGLDGHSLMNCADEGPEDGRGKTRVDKRRSLTVRETKFSIRIELRAPADVRWNENASESNAWLPLQGLAFVRIAKSFGSQHLQQGCLTAPTGTHNHCVGAAS